MRKLLISFIKKSESTLFGKYLLMTNTVSSGLLMWVGEVAAQRLDKSNKNGPHGETVYDNEKIKQLTVVGISQGPLHHYTYLWMERLLPGTARTTVFKKILSDQVKLHHRCDYYKDNNYCPILGDRESSVHSPLFLHSIFPGWEVSGRDEQAPGRQISHRLSCRLAGLATNTIYQLLLCALKVPRPLHQHDHNVLQCILVLRQEPTWNVWKSLMRQRWCKS